ncbi:M67 family metallopeptidase [Phototrophicus methaneseepsis]|uniref:M67 family metallopeptidase n=1 Tax=Phototrophicus methaneseepsis TaxID=2710758 RepID=A0A7S8IGV5_9CHLR|nr:M67 family metallopeptidase [Phototrophicus methaneseepsis]QPC85079.1 M67 family metallopeptidase [Phototrophicus methaneseepsis]
MDVKLSQALQQSIFQQMEANFPNEGGGFLLGSRTGDVVSIADVIGVENNFETEEQYHRYAMTPQNWAQMEDTADEQGLSIVGYYHSHPNAPAIPSEYDREHALPNFVYIITSVMAGEAVDMRVWLLQPDRSKFEPVSLSVEP